MGNRQEHGGNLAVGDYEIREIDLSIDLSIYEIDLSLWTARYFYIRIHRQDKLFLIPVHFKHLVIYSPR